MKTITKIQQDMLNVVSSQRCPVCNRVFMFTKFEDGMCHECKMYSEIISPTDKVETRFSHLERGHLYGTDAHEIYEKLCKKYKWNKSKSIGADWNNPMYMRVGVDKQVDVWFLNNPIFDGNKIDDSLKEHHFVDYIRNSGLHICEIFEDRYGSNFFQRNYIVTFVKTQNGYVFLGVYRVNYNCADGETIRNYYWRIHDAFPML